MRSIWAPGHFITQAHSSFLGFIFTHLQMQIWDCGWLVTLSRSHCRSSRGFGEPGQKRIKSMRIMRIIDFKNVRKTTKQIKRRVPRTDSARAEDRHLSATHGWGQPHLMYHSPVWLLTGTGQIRLTPWSCFRRGIACISEVWCPLPCVIQTNRDCKFSFIKAHRRFSLAYALSIPTPVLVPLPARSGNSTTSFPCSLSRSFQDRPNYRCFQPELKTNTVEGSAPTRNDSAEYDSEQPQATRFPKIRWYSPETWYSIYKRDNCAH